MDLTGTNLLSGTFRNFARALWGPCSEAQLKQPFAPLLPWHCFQANVIFLRIAKTGSTSFTSVLRRASARYGISGVDAKTPEHLSEPFLSAFHEERPHLDEKLKHMQLSMPRFYVTMLREPVERRISGFYYEASLKEGVKERGVLNWLQSFQPDWYYNALRVEESQPREEVMNSYDFVGITERFDESVVLLMNMLQLDSYCDVLYVSGKVGGESLAPSGEPWMQHIPLPEQPDEVRDYVESEEFRAIIASDREFYQQAIDRMDADIAKIGESEFKIQVEAFLSFKKKAEDSCHESLQVHGNWHDWSKDNCYHGDWGCGYKCFDAFCNAHGH